MGTVFSLYKRKPKQRYELGKARMGYAPGMEPPKLTLFQKIKAMNDLVQPGWGAMWSIMDTPNYSVFRLSRFSREDLADRIFRGSQNIDTIEDALKVADHMLAWAGDDEITLNPEEPHDLAELGWATRGYRDVGGIWDAFK